MPFGWVSAGLAIYNTLNSGGGGGGGGGGSAGGAPGAMTYVPQWQGGADQSWQQLMQHWGSLVDSGGAALEPYLGGALSSGMDAAGDLSGRMNRYGASLDELGGRFAGREASLTGAGDTLWNLALDPQNAQHDRLQQRVVDQSRAGTSARGIGMGGEAAGLEDQATTNFNLDWNNQMLQRAISGAQGMGGAYDAAGRQAQGMEGAYTGATNMYQGSYQLPYQLASLYGNAMGTSVYNPMNALGGNLAQYMGLGQSGSQAAFGQQQTNLNNLTSGLQSLSQQPWLQNLFSGGGGNWAGGSYTSNPSDIGYYGDGGNYGAGAGP